MFHRKIKNVPVTTNQFPVAFLPGLGQKPQATRRRRRHSCPDLCPLPASGAGGRGSSQGDDIGLLADKSLVKQ